MFDALKQKLLAKTMGLDEAKLIDHMEKLQSKVMERMLADFSFKHSREDLDHLMQRFFYHQAKVTQELMQDQEALPGPSTTNN